MKIFYITPHLSTGGMPEYLNNKIKKLKDDNDIWVFEKHHEPAYTIIRDRIVESIGDEKIITWGKTPYVLIDKINDLKPDIIHFEEPCEGFIDNIILDKIFIYDRKYKIFETFHDSSLNPNWKVYLPDKFLIVSPWQVSQFQSLNVPIEVIEHEIPMKTRDYNNSRRMLEFDVNKKHVVQIGIFTPRKNQRETIEIAKMLPDIQFHFVGTLADNFSFYWKPIVDNLPPNCIIHGERQDVDLFYQAADLIYLPSISLFNDKETSPLVIKEANLYNTNILMRNLDVYLNMYQESANLKFIKDKNKKMISSQILDILKIDEMTIKTPNKNMFSTRFEQDENKIFIEYNGDERFKCDVYVKDIDSEANILHSEFDFLADCVYWIIPIPKPYYDFYNNPKFGGFLIEYKKNNEIIHIEKIRFRDVLKRKCRLDTKEPVFSNHEDFFNHQIYANFLTRIYDRNTCVDIGANNGLFTELALINGFKKVIAVEPNPIPIKGFKQIHGNNESVILEEFAVSSTNEDLVLNIDLNNSLISSAYTKIGNDTITVKSKRLDEIISNYDKIDLMKMDIEGAEYDVLINANSETLSKIDNLLLEFHYNNGKNVLDLICALNYKGNFDVIKIYDPQLKNEIALNTEQGTIIAYRTNKI